MKITACRFALSAFAAKDEPRDPGPEVVFVGRSNVGKSALINRLLGVKGLARTSSQPGRTQSVNFYRVNEACWFVDLPGYGYAKVPERIRRAWGPMVQSFLERHSESIAMAVMVVDSRHTPSELDRTMQHWLDNNGIDYVVAATKADKLSGNGRDKAKKAVANLAGPGAVAAPMLVSSEKGTGVKELWRHLDRALESGNAGVSR